jgi:hypothetical protein
MSFGQMICNLICKKLGKIGINSSATNYKYDCKPVETATGESVAEDLYISALLNQDIKHNSNILIVGKAPDKLKIHLREVGHAVNVKSEQLFKENIDENNNFDYIFLLDDCGMAQNPDELVLKLAQISKYTPNMKICVTVANIGFLLTRLLLLFGRFSYTRRGILNLNSFHFFTMRSARNIFQQNGFTVSEIRGLPVPYSSLFSSDLLIKRLTFLHKCLIKIRKSLFSFQFVFFITPPISLQHFLSTAIEVSGQKSATIMENSNNQIQPESE